MDIKEEDLTILGEVYKVLEDKFAEDIKIIDIRKKSTIADYFVIASGKNTSQIKAIADWVEQKLESVGGKLKHKEGYNGSSWILLDFTTIIVHVFNKEERDYYELDKFWSDSPSIDLAILK